MKFIYVIFYLSVCSICSASTISINTCNLNEDLYSLSYNANNGDGTTLLVRLIANNENVILEAIDCTLGIPFAWYDCINIDNINPFASNFGTLSCIEIKKYNEFYLYSWAGENYDSVLEKPLISYDDTIVWGQFVISDNAIQLINSGTIINTPEPSVWILAIIGIGIILIKKINYGT